jgi:acyl carrier protein
MIGEIKLVLEQVTGRPGLAEELSDTADIVGEVGLTSLQMVDFMLHLEDRLDLEIEFQELEFDALRSIRELAGALARMRARAAPQGAVPA